MATFNIWRENNMVVDATYNDNVSKCWALVRTWASQWAGASPGPCPHIYQWGWPPWQRWTHHQPEHNQLLLDFLDYLSNYTYLWCDTVKCQLCLSSKFTHVVSPQLKQTMCTLFFSLLKVDSSSKCAPPLACRPGVRWCRPRSRAGCRRWSRGSSRSCSPPAPSWSPPHHSRGPAPANIVIMLNERWYNIPIFTSKSRRKGPQYPYPQVCWASQPSTTPTVGPAFCICSYLVYSFIYCFCKQYDEQIE